MADERGRDGKRLLLRFPEGSDLKERLEEVASGNARSLTAEILFRLEQSLKAGTTPDPEGDARSKLALQRLLRVGGQENATDDALDALAGEVDRLKADVAALKAKVGI